MLRRIACLVASFQEFMAHLLENWLMVGGRRLGRRQRCRLIDRAALRQSRGPQTRLGLVALDSSVELLDL
jgi:hypothetical protein